MCVRFLYILVSSLPSGYEAVEEGDLVVILSFHGEADGRVLLVEVAPKVIRVVLFHDGERVIYIALSFSRWFWGCS